MELTTFDLVMALKNHISVFVGLWIIFTTMYVHGQAVCDLTIDDIRTHISNQTCKDIAMPLAQCDMPQDKKKAFSIGICLRQAGVDSASIAFFHEAYALGLTPTHFPLLNIANAYAGLQEDSLAMTYVQLGAEKATMLYPWLQLPGLRALYERNPTCRALFDEDRPSFNHWTMLFVPIIFISLIQALIFFLYRKKFHRGTIFLSLLQLSFAALMVVYVLHWTRYTYEFPLVSNWWHPLYFLIGPAIYLYLKSIFTTDENVPMKAWRHFIVFVAMVVFLLPHLATPNAPWQGWPRWMIFIGFNFNIKIVHLAVYFILSYLIINRDLQIDEHIRQWTKIVFGFFAAFIVSNIVYQILTQWSGFNAEWDYFISGVMSICVLGIGLFGLIQPDVFRSMPVQQAIVPIKKYRTSGMTEQASLSLRKELEALMTEQEVYKENELRLDDLSEYLHASKHHVSQVINEHYGKNFFDFINSYRVSHVAARLANPNHEKSTIIQLAYEAGFNNKVSFNRAFKAAYQMTPSAYRKMKKSERTQIRLEKEN